jgi:hypothetical protein
MQVFYTIKPIKNLEQGYCPWKKMLTEIFMETDDFLSVTTGIGISIGRTLQSGSGGRATWAGSTALNCCQQLIK